MTIAQKEGELAENAAAYESYLDRHAREVVQLKRAHAVEVCWLCAIFLNSDFIALQKNGEFNG